MFVAISSTTGISIVSLLIALYVGVGSTGISPFSQGGAMAITGCRDDKVQEQLWSKQLLSATLFMLFYVLLAFLGVFDLFAGIF